MDENPDHLDNGLINFEKVCEGLVVVVFGVVPC